MITIPQSSKLGNDLRLRVEAAITELIERPPADAKEKIIPRLPKLLKCLKANPSPLRTGIARLAKQLFDLYANELRTTKTSGQRRKASKSLRVATAALYYLCEVDDVIPDYESHGFDDDAYALNYCAALLKHANSTWYRRACEALQ